MLSEESIRTPRTSKPHTTISEGDWRGMCVAVFGATAARKAFKNGGTWQGSYDALTAEARLVAKRRGMHPNCKPYSGRLPARLDGFRAVRVLDDSVGSHYLEHGDVAFYQPSNTVFAPRDDGDLAVVKLSSGPVIVCRVRRGTIAGRHTIDTYLYGKGPSLEDVVLRWAAPVVSAVKSHGVRRYTEELKNAAEASHG